MSSNTSLPDLPKAALSLPNTPLILAALTHIRKYTSPTTVNHCIRGAYFAVLLSRKVQRNSSSALDIELLVFSCLMHDLGWATDKSLLSKDKRFEVDGANMARSYLEENLLSKDWDRYRTQLMWDAIALHATPSFALHKEAEVKLAHVGIMADFFGPNCTGYPITVEEHKEILEAFPRLGFKEQFLDIMCGLCALKPETTFDNFVGDYGVQFGLDGKGTGKEKFAEEKLKNSSPRTLYTSIGACEEAEN